MAIKKLNFLGKQIWLTDETLTLLADVLNGKAPQEQEVKAEKPVEERTIVEHPVSGKEKEQPKENLSSGESQKERVESTPVKDLLPQKAEQVKTKNAVLTNILNFTRKHKKLFLGIGAVAALLIVLVPFAKAPAESLSEEERLQNTIKRISLCSELATVEYKVKVIHVEKDFNKILDWINNNITRTNWGDRAIAIETTATLKAGIDMKKFSADNVKVSDNSISVTLPKPELMTLDMGDIKSYEYTGLVRSKYKLNEKLNVEKNAEEELRNYQDSCDILIVSQKNAKSFFETLLKQLGYTSVTVNFN